MITREDIEKAFNEKVEFRLCSWPAETALRNPTISEIKAKLLKLADEARSS
ncbi:hypothetical protein [Rhizobium leguminosarum]|uniref:hypothetical protein n=1 Tax=Rhizobium leguminosarum TaxID=384 RepID=UPI0015FACA67|nr:hypothetical protein [Rhizobium leguminosarum]MBA9034954.1 hypothetical protein [Rhizobium leguminosarum]